VVFIPSVDSYILEEAFGGYVADHRILGIAHYGPVLRSPLISIAVAEILGWPYG
jgi:hypothetical protein